jgi:ATPase subunit of ABC transporter with duplicated ATPase domains
VDFLDSVAEIERAKENAVRRETAEQLDAYRKQQAAAQKVEVGAEQKQQTTSDSSDAWLTKKRRRKEVDNPISKLRKTSSGTAVLPHVSPTVTSAPEANGSPSAPERPSSTVQTTSMELPSSKPEQPLAVADTSSRTADLGLGAYSSDED